MRLESAIPDPNDKFESRLLLNSSAGSEQPVEDVAEPCLEHIDIALCDGKAFWPAVADGPVRKGEFLRAASARSGLCPKIVIEDIG